MIAAILRGLRIVGLDDFRKRAVSVYVDEAAQFSGSWLAVALEQLRKAHTSFTLAVQHLGQLSRAGGDAEAILSSIGSVIAMGAGLGDVDRLARVLRVEPEEIIALNRGEAFYAGLTEDWARAPARRLERLPGLPHDQAQARGP